MKKIIATVIAGLILTLSPAFSQTPNKVKSYDQGINIIPAPVSLVQNEGTFKLMPTTKFYAPTPEAKTVATFFAARVKKSTGYTLGNATQEGKGVISLKIDPSISNKEGYTLDVTSSEVKIAAKTDAGLFYGMETLLQLLPAEIESAKLVSNVAWNIPAVSIKDEPRFEWRGMMLDACRHFIPIENVKKQIDVLAMFKVNRLHWHLTDDQGWRIEIKKYPKLTQIGSTRVDGEGTTYSGFYTQEQIKDVVKYAAARHITIVPEIEMPGHERAAIAAYPELSCAGKTVTPRVTWGVEPIVLCAGKDDVFKFLEDVIAEVAPLFPGEYFHVGGDECPKDSWKTCPLCQQRIKDEGIVGDEHHTAEEKLQSYFIQRMEKVVNKYGKKLIGWDEILEGGLAPSATVMSWRGEAGGIAAALMNHDVVMTPGSNGMYLDQFQGDPKIQPVAIGGYTTLQKTYSYNPTPDTLVAMGKAKFIKGVQCNIWTEYMYNTNIMEYRIYPRILALSEIAWTPLNRKDYKDFERRVNNGLVRLDGHNINYYIPLPEQPKGSCNTVAFTDKANMVFTTTQPVKMVYTLDGTQPTAKSKVYTAPIVLTKTTTLKIASVLSSGKMSKTRVIKVEKQAYAPAKKVASTTPGLKMKTTDGMFLNTSKLATVKNWRESTISSLNGLVTKTDEQLTGLKSQYANIATGYVNIPADGIYYFNSENEEVWIDGKLIVNNSGEVKRFSRHDGSIALAKGLHEIKVVFLGHIIGGWPSNWGNGTVKIREANQDAFSPIDASMLCY
jgi:hexosaminidase